jgi:putative FmdB family regulatory protein
MPFYEYQCQACSAQVEVLQKISDAPLKKCHECGRNKLIKLVSAPVFRLKGGGWYETDFKGDKDNKRNLVDSEPAGEAKSDDKAAPADKKVEASTDSKPDSKPESKSESKSDRKPEGRSDARSNKRPITKSRPAPAKAAKSRKPAKSSKPAKAARARR